MLVGLTIANIIGWVTAHWRWLLYLVVGIALIVGVALIFRACNKPPKLDEKEIQRAQQAIAKEDRKVLIEILANSDAREAAIDANLKEAEEVREQSVKNYQNLSNDELAAELERRK